MFRRDLFKENIVILREALRDLKCERLDHPKRIALGRVVVEAEMECEDVLALKLIGILDSDGPGGFEEKCDWRVHFESKHTRKRLLTSCQTQDLRPMRDNAGRSNPCATLRFG